MLKQYIVLPKKPKMSPGKLVSQGVHASFMALEKQRNTTCKRHGIFGLYDAPFGIDYIEAWKSSGQCVIVCQVPSDSQLFGLKEYCEEWKVPCHLYVDEGHTEVSCGQATAFATGVVGESCQWMFEKLELYK